MKKEIISGFFDSNHSGNRNLFLARVLGVENYQAPRRILFWGFWKYCQSRKRLQ